MGCDHGLRAPPRPHTKAGHLGSGREAGLGACWSSAPLKGNVPRQGRGSAGERELTEREPDPVKRTNKRNAEAGKRRKEKGQEGGGKAERRSKGEEKGEHRRKKGKKERTRERVEPAPRGFLCGCGAARRCRQLSRCWRIVGTCLRIQIVCRLRVLWCSGSCVRAQYVGAVQYTLRVESQKHGTQPGNSNHAAQAGGCCPRRGSRASAGSAAVQRDR